MIEVKNITKNFRDGDNDIAVLKPTNIVIEEGQFVAIVGPSGSGKSTLLTIMGALQQPTSGTLIIDNKDVYQLNENQRSNLRFKSIGFVLQGSNLVPYLTVKEQFELKLNQAKIKEKESIIKDILNQLSIEKIKNKYPDEISGGERQRVAIGLSLCLNPSILLADEPTASLDTEKAFDVVKNLKDISKKRGTSVVMVTHDQRMLAYCDRVFEMRDGILTEKNS